MKSVSEAQCAPDTNTHSIYVAPNHSKSPQGALHCKYNKSYILEGHWFSIVKLFFSPLPPQSLVCNSQWYLAFLWAFLLLLLTEVGTANWLSCSLPTFKPANHKNRTLDHITHQKLILCDTTCWQDCNQVGSVLKISPPCRDGQSAAGSDWGPFCFFWGNNLSLCVLLWNEKGKDSLTVALSSLLQIDETKYLIYFLVCILNHNTGLSVPSMWNSSSYSLL